jgi:hypothetical protein
VAEGASVLRLEERRRGLSPGAFLGKLCTAWLKRRAFIVQRGSNWYGRFLEVAVYAV